MNCIVMDYSIRSDTDRRKVLCSATMSGETEKSIDILVLTLITYVREQSMSPIKKSLNSTGYNPAKNKRH